MKYGARLVGSACLAISVVFCLSVLFNATICFVAPAHAEQIFLTGTVSSSPSSGPAGATISVSGSGWSEPDGEQVSLGYMIASYCAIVSKAQASTFKNGSFNGSLRLPTGTPLGTYSICATFSNTTAVANTYTILTESSPQISISLSTQSGQQQATVSGSNYFPAGTTVNLFWETINGAIIITITPAVSNSSGHISSAFTVPTSVASGSYKIVATISGQTTLNSSVPFAYNAPTPLPTPSPSPTLPTPSPSPTQQLSPTVVATTVTSTPTISATKSISSQDTNTGQTPSPGTTTNGARTNQSTNIVLIGSIIGLFIILAIILMIIFFLRRKKARSEKIATAVGPMKNGPIPWQNNQSGSIPTSINNGSIAASPPWQTTSATPPQQLQISPYAHLLQQPGGGNPVITDETYKSTPDDLNLESIKQQAQMGLFALPGNRKDG